MNGSIYVDPHPQRVVFMSVIVKRSAVAKSYSGGVEGFLARYQPTRQDALLFSLPFMSMDDVEHILALLNDEGIIPGEDIAVCDMRAGPLLHCDGVRMELDSTDDFHGTWFTYYDPAYVASSVPEAPCDPTEPLVANEPPAPPVVTTKGESTAWHRVTFGSGPVHCVGGDDDDDEPRLIEHKRPASAPHHSLPSALLSPVFSEDWSSRAYEATDPRVLEAALTHIEMQRYVDRQAKLSLDAGDGGEISFEDAVLEGLHDGAKAAATFEAMNFFGEPFPVTVMAFAGIYWVEAPEFDIHGYYLNFQDAEADALHLVECYPADGDVSCEADHPRYKLARLEHAQGEHTGPLHVVRIDYVDSLCAAHGQTDKAQGSHTILVASETLENIRNGELVETIGQGIVLYGEGPFEDNWRFNDPCRGVATIFLDTLNGEEVDWLEAIAVWFDDEEQPKPPGYFED